MVYNYVSFIKALKSMGGIDFVDELWGIVQEEILVNSEWEGIAAKFSPQAWKDIISKVESFDEMTDEDVDGFNEFVTKSPRDIKDPVWMSWGTVSFISLVH